MEGEVRSVIEYHADVDPLHRNVWPVRVGDDKAAIGYLTEHITVQLDGVTPPVTRWSWRFDDVEAERLGLDEVLRFSRGQYTTWGDALQSLARLHQVAVALRDPTSGVT